MSQVPTRLVALPRRFILRDGLVLMVPLALSFTISRGVLPEFRDRLALVPRDNTPRWIRYSGIGVNLASRFVAMGMLGLLVCRMMRPRPGLRRISRQPGTVACVAGAAAMMAGGLMAAGFVLVHDQSTWQSGVSRWASFESTIAPAVIAAWAALWISGRWRAERTWVDRAGRVLGAYWIVLIGYRYVMGFVWPAYWIQPQ